jgi:hypothetical protein
MRDWNRQRKSSVMASVVGHQSAAHEFLFFFLSPPPRLEVSTAVGIGGGSKLEVLSSQHFCRQCRLASRAHQVAPGLTPVVFFSFSIRFTRRGTHQVQQREQTGDRNTQHSQKEQTERSTTTSQSTILF